MRSIFIFKSPFLIYLFCFSANSFSSRMVGEVLAELLHQVLKFYPDNDSWLKVLGDINFGITQFCSIHKFSITTYIAANGFSASALKNYLEACIAVSGYFSRPVPRFEIDDQVYKRMIKCCSQLQCHTQVELIFNSFYVNLKLNFNLRWQSFANFLKRWTMGLRSRVCKRKPVQMPWMRITTASGM